MEQWVRPTVTTPKLRVCGDGSVAIRVTVAVSPSGIEHVVVPERGTDGYGLRIYLEGGASVRTTDDLREELLPSGWSVRVAEYVYSPAPGEVIEATPRHLAVLAVLAQRSSEGR